LGLAAMVAPPRSSASRNRVRALRQLQVSGLQPLQYVWSITGWLLSFALFAWFLKTYTDTDVPYADGFLTAGSLLGQLLLSRKNGKIG